MTDTPKPIDLIEPTAAAMYRAQAELVGTGSKPDANVTSLTSIAISLRRIADALDRDTELHGSIMSHDAHSQ